MCRNYPLHPAWQNVFHNQDLAFKNKEFCLYKMIL